MLPFLFLKFKRSLIMELSVVILAAGKGTRMKSILPKVMQPLAGKPLLAHVLSTAKQIAANKGLLGHYRPSKKGRVMLYKWRCHT